MTETLVLIISLVLAAVAFAVAAWMYKWVKAIPVESARVEDLRVLIADGAKTFIREEYKRLGLFAGIAFVLILIFLPSPIWQGNAGANVSMAIAYVAGTVISAISGVVGVTIATEANARSAEAAQTSLTKSFLVGYRGGSVMGMAVVGSSLAGVGLVYWITGDASSMLGFSFGASTLALFAKVGGGIFTKTADVSADIVGKVELGIPEDDPRNPAVIADNVGDNVGDVAGMGADLFDSNVAAYVAAVVIALTLGGAQNASIIFILAGLGIIASIIGIFSARIGPNGNPSTALNLSTYVTGGAFIALTAAVWAILNLEWRLWGAAMVGLAAGIIIGLTSDYFTNDDKPPVRTVARLSRSGPAFTILGGTSYGFMSVLPALVGIGVAAVLAWYLTNPLGEGYALFGIALSAIGMLAIVGTTVSNDAFGPIVDNARGLVEMADLGEEALERTDALDSAGNTVKAITKGFSIGAAGLTVISLLGAFIQEVNVAAVEMGLVAKGVEYLQGFDIMDPLVFCGLLVGTAVPAVFSAMLINGVNRNSERMVAEIHRQWREIPGLADDVEGVRPDYDRCISIATTGALKELVPAGLFVIAMTLLVGFIGGVRMIGGFLAGNITSGMLLALYMSNAGGLWDNSKKYVEAGNEGGKGSEAHKAAVIGDTVGDPFKDTAGPSINTQITVVSLLASLFVQLFLAFSLF